MQHPMIFSVMATEPPRWADRAEILHGLLYTASFLQLLAIFWLGRVRSQSYDYDVIRGTASDRFFKEIVFSDTWLAAIDRNVYIMHDLGQQMTTNDL